MFRAIRFLLVWYNLAFKVPWFIPLQIFLCERGGGEGVYLKERKSLQGQNILKQTSVAEINWKITSIGLVPNNEIEPSPEDYTKAL